MRLLGKCEELLVIIPTPLPPPHPSSIDKRVGFVCKQTRLALFILLSIAFDVVDVVYDFEFGF